MVVKIFSRKVPMPTVLESCTSAVRIGRPIAGDVRFLEDPFPSQCLLMPSTVPEEDCSSVTCDVCGKKVPRELMMEHICQAD